MISFANKYSFVVLRLICYKMSSSLSSSSKGLRDCFSVGLSANTEIGDWSKIFGGIKLSWLLLSSFSAMFCVFFETGVEGTWLDEGEIRVSDSSDTAVRTGASVPVVDLPHS